MPSGKKRPLFGTNVRIKKSSSSPAATVNQNPFERRKQNQKFKVLGRKSKGQEQKHGEARSRAMEIRKETLGVELNQRGKANEFVDKRFGESNDTLSKEERMLIRFQRERQKGLKKNIFNIDEDEGEEAVLTHKGAALSSLDLRDDYHESDPDDDEDGGNIGEEQVAATHFGGFVKKSTSSGDGDDEKDEGDEDAEGRRKSKKEVMSELIAKSKFYKMERQKVREENEDLKDKLDEDFAAIAGSLALRDKDKEREEARLERAALKNVTKGTVLPLNPPVSATSTSTNASSSSKVVPAASSNGNGTSAVPTSATTSATALTPALTTKQAKMASDLAFDQMVRELTFDFKAKAADRTKTPEEIAREERDRLELLERARLARMKGDYDSDEEKQKRRAAAAGTAPSSARGGGDDLDDDYYAELKTADGDGTNVKKRQKVDSLGNTIEGDDDEGDEDDEADDDEDGKSSKKGRDDGEISRHERRRLERREQRRLKKLGITSVAAHPSSLLASKAPAQEQLKAQLKANAGTEIADIPFVIPAPATYGEFAALVKNKSDPAVKLILDRILACTHPSLGNDNISKLKVFFVVLLEYVGVLASEPASASSRNRLDYVCSGPLFSIAQTAPEAATAAAKDILENINKQLLAFIAKKIDHPTAKLAGVRKALYYLKIFASLFSVSDFQQVVATPSQLLLGEWLSRYPISTASDLISVSFAATLSLLYLKPSKRFMPEVINFLLHAIRLAAAPSSATGVDVIPDTVATYQFDNKALLKVLRIDGADLSSVSSIHSLSVALLDDRSPKDPVTNSAQFRCDALVFYTRLLNDFVSMFANNDAFPEIFEPFMKPLDALLALPKLPPVLVDAIRPARDAIAKHLAAALSSRRPLRRQAEKPAELRQFNPKFEEKLYVNASYDPDKERVKLKKLKRKLKDEQKGAMRELRKDAQFLQMQKDSKRREEDSARAAKQKDIEGWLSRQQQEAAVAERDQMRMRKKQKRQKEQEK